jgi:hypothetical protein
MRWVRNIFEVILPPMYKGLKIFVEYAVIPIHWYYDNCVEEEVEEEEIISAEPVEEIEEEMYLRTEHHLEHPICQCYYDGDFSSYNWHIHFHDGTKVGLTISCKKCGTELKVPNKNFRARIVVKNVDEERKNYNKAKTKQDKEEEKKFVPKVLEFPNREEDGSE